MGIPGENLKGRRKFNLYWSIILIAVLCLILYISTYGVYWYSDDFTFVLHNQSLRSLSNIDDFFLDPVGTTAPLIQYKGDYRPIRTLSWAIDYQIWGLRPFGFRLSNLLLHILVSCLVGALCRLLGATQKASFFAAALFAAHPAQVETVVWIAARGDGLFTLFLLASFYLFIRSRESDRFPSLPLAGSLLFFILALLSKEAAITLPLLLIAYDVIVKRPNKIARSRVVTEYFTLIAIGVLYFMVRLQLLGIVARRDYYGGGLWPTFLTMSKCFAIYLQLVFWPSPKNCRDFAVPIAHSIMQANVLGSLLLLLVVIGIFILLWRYRPVAGYGLAWFFLALLPVSNIIPNQQLMTERYLYLPLVGIAIMGASLFSDIEALFSTRLRKAANLALVLLLATYGSITAVKASAWRDPEILVRQSLEIYPNSFDMLMDLGTIYYGQGFYNDAIAQFTKAMHVSPENHRTGNLLCSMGNCYREKGDYRTAIGLYSAALRRNPDSPDIHIELGIVYLLQGNDEKAAGSFQRAVELDPKVRDAIGPYVSKIINGRR